MTTASRQAMINRKRVTFGPAYIRDVIAGVQRDFDKQMVHAIRLGVASARKLSRMDPYLIRARLAQKLIELKAKGEESPKAAKTKFIVS